MFSENEPSEISERRLSEGSARHGPADEDRDAAEVEGLGGGGGVVGGASHLLHNKLI